MNMKKNISIILIFALIVTGLGYTPAVQAATTTLTNPQKDQNGVVTWDCIYFGNYYQSFYEPKEVPENPVIGEKYVDEDGTEMIYKGWYRDEQENVFEAYIKKEPIKWRVLSQEGNDVFLMSDSVIDAQPYQEYSWKESHLRSWLNSSFVDKAFTKAEQAAIQDTTVEKNSVDKVYILSSEEATDETYGFVQWTNDWNDYTLSYMPKKVNCATNTNYVQKIGKWTQYTENEDQKWTGNYDETTKRASYWLRSELGESAGSTMNFKGKSCFGEAMDSLMAVRPVLHLDLSKRSVWSKADSVNQNGEIVTESELDENKDETTTYGLKNPRKIGTEVVFEQDTVWDCVYFGNYPQSDETGTIMEPIKWRVLAVDGDDAFLVADQNLDAQPYANTNITWETCSLRRWLNDSFMKEAFSDSEQLAITQTKVTSENGKDNTTETFDSIYLLSAAEIPKSEFGFYSGKDPNSTLAASKTDYIKVDEGPEDLAELGLAVRNGEWWLRDYVGEDYFDSECRIQYAKIVTRWGGVFEDDGIWHDILDERCVRPVLHINLSDFSGWSYAGTVTAQGTVEPTITPTVVPTATPTTTTTPIATTTPTQKPTQDEVTIPTVGTKLKNKGNTANYVVKAVKGNTVEVQYLAPVQKTKKVTIPKMVTLANGTIAKVTTIANNAFKNNKVLQEITIGSDVTTIGKNAFKNCKKLKTIIIKSKKLKTLSKSALKGISAKVTIKVPASKYKEYKKLLRKSGLKKTVKIQKY